MLNWINLVLVSTLALGFAGCATTTQPQDRAPAAVKCARQEYAKALRKEGLSETQMALIVALRYSPMHESQLQDQYKKELLADGLSIEQAELIAARRYPNDRTAAKNYYDALKADGLSDEHISKLIKQPTCD